MANVAVSELIDSLLQETADATQKNSILEYLGVGSGSEATFKSIVLASPSANTAFLAATGFSLTGSNAQSMIDLAGTWNTSGAPAAIKLRITDTASAITAKLVDLQMGSYTAFRVADSAISGYAGVGTSLLLGSNGGDVGIEAHGNSLYLGQGNNHNVEGPGFKFIRPGAGYGLDLGSSAIVSLLGGTEAGGAATLQLGRTHATTPTKQTIKAHDVTTGTGANLELSGGTGSVANGAAFFNNPVRPETGDSTAGLINLLNSAYDAGLLSPALNEFSSFSNVTSNSIYVDLLSANAEDLQWNIDAQIATDGAFSNVVGTATSAETGDSIHPGSLNFESLSAETTYYVRWRSVATNNADVYSTWSATQTQATDPA